MGQNVEGHSDGGDSGRFRKTSAEQDGANDSQRYRPVLSDHQDQTTEEDESQQAFGQEGHHSEHCQKEAGFEDAVRSFAVHTLSLVPSPPNP